MTKLGTYSLLLQGTGLVLALIMTNFLDPHWTTFLFTLTGGVLFCLGVRSKRTELRLFGLLLQLASVYVFLDAVWYPFRAAIFLNLYFLGSCTIVLAAFFSIYCMERGLTGSSKWDNIIFLLLFLIGVPVWYMSGIREIFMHIVVPERLSGVLLFISGTSIITGIIAEKMKWVRLNCILLLQLPAMLLVLFLELVPGSTYSPLLIGWGAAVWPITFFVQYRILAVLDGLQWSKIGVFYHLISLWIFLFVSIRELILKFLQLQPAGIFSIIAFVLLCIIAWLFVLLFMTKKGYWPVSVYPSLYILGGGGGVVLFFFAWMVKLIGS